MKQCFRNPTISGGLLILALWVNVGSASTFEPPKKIKAAAESFVSHQTHAQSVEARGIDSRLKLPKCGRKLEASASAIRRRVTTVEVRCAGPQPWKIYVPVEAIEREQVVVTRHGVSRGTVLSLEDIELAERDVRQLPYGYHRDVKGVLGSELRRSLAAGEVLVPDALRAAVVVERGQNVTLVSQRKGVIVKSSGIALSDGAKRQRIRVKTKSDRVVEGVVESAQEVRVGL